MSYGRDAAIASLNRLAAGEREVLKEYVVALYGEEMSDAMMKKRLKAYVFKRRSQPEE
jgi:hypothetical protein